MTHEPRFHAVSRTMVALVAALLMVGASVLTAPAAHAAPVTQDRMTFQTHAAGTATVTGYTGPASTLTTLAIPGTITDNGTDYAVTTIGDNAFDGTALTTVTIPDSVTAIGHLAFYSTPLSSVSIGNAVTTIGTHAFASTALITVTLPDSVTTIDFAAFYLSRLTSVSIPDSVTTIGEAAFAVTPLNSVTIGNSVTTIGNDAFRITNLTTVSLPDSVTTIGDNAFDETALASAVFQGAPPTVFTANGPAGSLGDNPGVIVYYPPAFAAGYAPGGASTWHGYAAAPWPTIAFDLGGHGTGIADVILFPGDPAPTPTAPTAASVNFAGWFTASTGGTAFDFAAPRFTDTTAFAQWTTPAASAPASTLPPTGAEHIPMLAAGSLMLLLGVLTLAWARRRALLA